MAAFAQELLSIANPLEQRNVGKVLRATCGSLVRDEIVERQNRDHEIAQGGLN